MSRRSNLSDNVNSSLPNDRNESESSDELDDSLSSERDISESEADSLATDKEPLLSNKIWVPIHIGEKIINRQFSFVSTPGLKVSIDKNSNPLQILELFFDENIMKMIVTETNRYADQDKSSKSTFSRSKRWTPITVEELWMFVALLILQSVVHKPVQRWYWTNNKTIETPIFSDVMTSARFELIIKYLHFLNNETFDPATHPCPKLKKICELFTMLTENFQSVYTLEKDICIDGSLMSYKVRLSWIQFIRSKRSRFGIKSFVLCESESGYIWNSIIYTGKTTILNEKYAEFGMTGQVVLTLSEKLLNKGYRLTMDNFYNSPQLFQYRIENDTDAFGTIRINRKNLPTNFGKKNLKKGESVSWMKENLVVMRWRDKRDVSLISTFHDTSFVDATTKTGKIIHKPQIVVDYNATMGGVDKADQQIALYSMKRKQQKKYYKKIFRHLLEQTAFNSFVPYKKYCDKNLTNADFQLYLCEEIF